MTTIEKSIDTQNTTGQAGAAVLTPIGDKILVEPIENDQKVTDSGIYIPDTSKDKPQVGIVKAVGAGRILESGKLMPLTVKPGDKVVFRQFAGTEISLSKKDGTFLLMTERDVYCVVTKKETANA